MWQATDSMDMAAHVGSNAVGLDPSDVLPAKHGGLSCRTTSFRMPVHELPQAAWPGLSTEIHHGMNGSRRHHMSRIRINARKTSGDASRLVGCAGRSADSLPPVGIDDASGAAQTAPDMDFKSKAHCNDHAQTITASTTPQQAVPC